MCRNSTASEMAMKRYKRLVTSNVMEGFENGSIRIESGANVAMTTSADVSCLKAQVSRFSKLSILLFISLNISTSWTEQLIVCNFGRGRIPPIFLVLSLAAFTFGMILKTTYDGKNGL